MAHLQYVPGDPRLVDQLVYELKSKGIFDQFRKECISDVDTRPAYQNLRQRVEGSVSSFLSRQIWKPDLNKNQLREKLRKHLLDGNYLEQGVERIVDQVVNPKVASVFIPQVEDVVYNFLGIPRKKSVGVAETSNGKVSGDNDLLPTDLEAVSPGSVKSNDCKSEAMDTSESKDDNLILVDDEASKSEIKDDIVTLEGVESVKIDNQDSRLSGISELTLHGSDTSIDKSSIPLPKEEIKLENIPAPENSPPNIKNKNIDLEKINLPNEPNLSTDIPLPDELLKPEKELFFKPMQLSSEDEESSSNSSSLRRNMSPLTPIRNYNNENSCDAQQAFENYSDGKGEDKKEPSTFRFTIETKSDENICDVVKNETKDSEVQNLSYQLSNQVNINTFNTPLYDESSNSNNLRIDYESDANSKATTTGPKLPEPDQNTGDSNKKVCKPEEKKASHKSSHRSRDSHRHSSSKDKRSNSKQSNSRDSSRYYKKSSKDDKSSTKSSHKEKSSDKTEKKDSRDSSKQRSSHKSSSNKDSKSHRSSSSSKHSSKHDEKKSSSSSHKEKEKSTDKSKDRSKDSKSSSHRSDKDRKSSSKSKHDEKENKEKKDKKEPDDHYSLSGRGNPNRRSTDRDSNDGNSSSSKGSHNPSSSKSSEIKKETKGNSKTDNTSTSSNSTSPSDKDNVGKEIKDANNTTQSRPIVRVETHLEMPISTPPRLPFVPDVTLKKPRFAANLEEAKKMIKMRKFLEEEQKRMNQEAALLLEFQANVRPSLSQVYSNISGPELEFACVSNSVQPTHTQVIVTGDDTVEQEANEVKTETLESKSIERINNTDNIMVNNLEGKDLIAETLIAMHQEDITKTDSQVTQEGNVITEIVNENEHSSNDNNKSIIEILSNNEESHKPIDNQAQKSVLKTRIKRKMNSEQFVIVEPKLDNSKEEDDKKCNYFEVTVITEELSESEESNAEKDSELKMYDEISEQYPDENLLQYFAEHEKYSAELERDKFSKFLKAFTEKISKNKLYLINCDTYEENLIKEVSKSHGTFEIVSYQKNGYLKVPKVMKNVNVTTEITLPTKSADQEKVHSTSHSPVYSPVKSECSFELSSDYDAKLEEMVNRTSRQEIMEIILGGVIDESPSKMPKIDYCLESSIERAENTLKRKIFEVETTVNNNRPVLASNKIRKLSGSDQITSTTEEAEEAANNNIVQNNTRSKFLGKARRVGLPRPKRPNFPNSPSSDKSVENYEQNTLGAPPPVNGKMKGTPRRKVQRYDPADLYKPKLHYLSRRNVNS